MEKRKVAFPSYDTFIRIPSRRGGERRHVTECNICGALVPKWSEWTHNRWHLGNGDIGENPEKPIHHSKYVQDILDSDED